MLILRAAVWCIGRVEIEQSAATPMGTLSILRLGDLVQVRRWKTVATIGARVGVPKGQGELRGYLAARVASWAEVAEVLAVGRAIEG